MCDRVTLPYHWAPYLINGDASGLDDGEPEYIDRYLWNTEAIIDVDHNSTRFTWSYDLYGGTAKGGDVADYITI